MTSVLIVGAGPVGLTMAMELARYGVSVRIIDQASSRSEHSKALVIWSRTLELLERSGCVPAFLKTGFKVQSASIHAGKRLIGNLHLDQVKSAYPFALMVPQYDTERLLEEQLNSLGVQVERQSKLTHFTDAGAFVTSLIQRADGSSESIQSEWLIGCDGCHSLVRHSLGKTFQGSSLQDGFILADVRLHTTTIPRDEISTYFHPDGPLIFFPFGMDRFRIIASTGPITHGRVRPEPTLAQVQAIVDQRGPGCITVFDPLWLAEFAVNERKVEDYRSGRVFLAGDSAHIHSPAGGRGMNTGMQDAFNLAWKLALVCKDLADLKLLESYSIERSTIGDHVLANTGRLTKIGIMKNHTLQEVRNWTGHFLLGFSAIQHAMTEGLMEVSVGYPKSPLNSAPIAAIHGPTPGARWTPVPGEPPIGAGNTPRFALFAATDANSDPFLEAHADLLEERIRPPLDDQGIWLVRPDGYVAAVEKTGGWGKIAEYLARISPKAKRAAA